MDTCNKCATDNKHKNPQKLYHQENRNRKIYKIYVMQTKIINMMNKSMTKRELNKKSRIRNILRMKLINIWSSSFWPEGSCQVKIIEFL